MITAPLPLNEDLRIEELNSYKILDSSNEQEYDDLVELASQICDCPIALITFVDKKRQWFKAKKNLSASETSRDVAFCAHTILQDDIFVVEDAATDKRFYDNPLVTGDTKIGFYAGAPIYTSSGNKLGTICVIDHIKKNNLSKNQNKALKIIANQISNLLELRAKNKLILEQSKSVIKAEKKFSQQTISNSDSKDNFIAHELNENLGQSLSAIKLFIETAENSKENQDTYLKKSKETITKLISEVNYLSKSLSPTTFKNINYYWFIEDFGLKFGELNNINVVFNKDCKLISRKSDYGLNIFRIFENLFEIAKTYQSKDIFVSINDNDDLKIEFKFNSKLKIKKELIATPLNNISTRVDLLKGSTLFKYEENECVFKLLFPKTN